MPTITRSDYLEFSAVLALPVVYLATPAWWVTSLAPLDEGVTVRGETREIPGLAGTISPGPDELDELTLTLPMVLRGDFDQDGVAYGNKRTGWNTNLAWLRTNLVRPVATATGLRPCVWHRSGLANLSAQVKVTDFAIAPVSNHTATAALTLVVPAGEFT